ncbi:MAG TPA: fructosamine kinase family protein [Rhodanobacteraceae bacterium]|nr:fructosamine kinase family protein [Rhodanobacteraceae bacterium]
MSNRDARGAYVKRRDTAPAGFFEAEARGLAALRDARALRVPAVFEVDRHHIVLEDLGHGVRAADYWQRAGAGLAVQHHVTGVRFGFTHDGFCGDAPQANTPDADGWRFFAERRLLPQTRQARDRGLIEAGDAASVETLCAGLRERIPALPAVLLHGDLWSGNLQVCGDGSPALIDAGAVHYGWAEAELAMLTLFGSPPAAFFDAYMEHAPLRRDWHTRAPVYNLYHLLNHVNLFGTCYVAQLRAALAGCA